MQYCVDCGAPLKLAATHCLECGEVIVPLSQPVADQRFVRDWAPASMPHMPTPVQQQISGDGLAQAQTPVMYEPSILQRWLSQSKLASPPVRPQQTQASIGNRGMALFVQLIYFILVGIWMSQLWIIFAWLIGLTVIGLPVSAMMVRLLPQIAFLSSKRVEFKPLQAPTNRGNQVPVLARVIYFVLIGWWVSLLWMQLAWVAGITIVGLPISREMLKVMPTVTTLSNH